jgi:hypothetical protein
MMDVALRLALVLVSGVVVVWLADRRQRRRPRARTQLTQGIALVVTPACRLCDAVRRRLQELQVPHAIVRADDARLGPLSLRSAPVLLRIDHEGRVAVMRSGRAAIEQLDDVIGTKQRRGAWLA